MTLPGLELLIRVGFATLLGIAIGIERQWRSRMAGLQTMALVSMGAALFLILGAYTFHHEQDPTRVAAQIVTGIGFLGAGVIMKQGSSVTGLNTAATLWATAAVGALAGAWMWREATVGAGIIIVGNSFLHPLAVRMDRAKSKVGRETPAADYVFEVECAASDEARVKVLLLDALTQPGLQLKSVRSVGATTPGAVGLRTELTAATRQDELCVRRIDDALERVAERGGECDIVHDVAYQVPMHMIADIVGIPEADRPAIFTTTEKLWRCGDPKSSVSVQEGLAAQAEIYRYGVELAAAKRARPEDDVLSILASAEIETDDGDRTRLQDHELENFFFILTLAGSETTTNAITQGLLALLEHLDQLAALRADRSLLDTAIEEILRWACPVTLFGRVARRDVELDGCEIRKGERVTMWYPSANRDERVFEEAFRFDIRRHPNPHVSFGGGGVHYCMGASLARLEMRTVFERLLDRFRNIEMTGPLEWGAASPDQNGAATPVHLPVRLRA